MEETTRINGVGPHPQPWPKGKNYDKVLLKEGDRRNVEDKYRYWTVQAIKHDMAKHAFDLEIAIENYQHDFNIGTVVRNANAFNVRAVHIIGKKHWNRRGAMVTDAYLNVIHHKTTIDFLNVVKNKQIVGVDNIAGSSELHTLVLPQKPVLVFGSEGPGLTDEMKAKCHQIVAIEQFGSTRSINVGVASGILMYKWVETHILK